MILNLSRFQCYINPILFNVEWDLLQFLQQQYPIDNLSMVDEYKNLSKCWHLQETIGHYKFSLYRDKNTRSRVTEFDDLGCVGCGSINKQDDRVYLTEGVSDFITVKLTHPNNNVIGFTTLSGNYKAKSIVLSLFNRICIVSDNDFKGSVNTGLTNASKMLKYYQSFNKNVSIQLPDAGFKDITEQFMANLRFAKFSM